MPVADLSQSDQQVLRWCVGFILRGGRFDLEQAMVRLGVSGAELAGMEREWPPDDRVEDGRAFVAINNVLNEVCHGPDRPSEQEWDCAGVTRDRVLALYQCWAESHGLKWTGVR